MTNAKDMFIKEQRSSRGFTLLTFKDRYGQLCSIQDSSLATEAAIWFGVDNTGPEITGPNGKTDEPVDARMHLTSDQVKSLLPILQRFVENGSL